MANKNALREATVAIKAGANAETTVTLCKNTISDLKKLPAEQKEKPAAVLGVLAQNEATAAVIVREGALNPLVQLLGGFDGGASAAANALSALANLHQRYRQAIAKAGALAPLVSIGQKRVPSRERYQPSTAAHEGSPRVDLSWCIVR